VDDYKQAQAQGWQVRGGERSTQIQHWIWEEERVRIGRDGQPVLDSQNKAIKDLVRLERPKVITAAVFNAEQIDGIPHWNRKRTMTGIPLSKLKSCLQASGAKIEHLRVEELITVSHGYDSLAGAGAVCETQRLLRDGVARARALDSASGPARPRP
jgi:Antirestriction protein